MCSTGSVMADGYPPPEKCGEIKEFFDSAHTANPAPSDAITVAMLGIDPIQEPICAFAFIILHHDCELWCFFGAFTVEETSFGNQTLTYFAVQVTPPSRSLVLKYHWRPLQGYASVVEGVCLHW
jgi:hypothetical protein